MRVHPSRLKRRIVSLSTQLIAGNIVVFSGSAIAQEAQSEQLRMQSPNAARSASRSSTASKALTPQPSAAATADPAAGTATSTPQIVSVTAERPHDRIDRQVYNVRSNIDTSNDSAADALNNVPSVSVAPDGTVTLRGSANVQVQIDGKPSAMLQGANRGPTLQSMPSDNIESIEVINNPGSEFGNESGGGPIINLVTRRNRKPGGFGSLNATRGTAGRTYGAFSGSYNSGRWGVRQNLSFRHEERDLVGLSDREYKSPVTGLTTNSTQASTSINRTDSFTLGSGLSYNLGDKDVLSAEFSMLSQKSAQRGTDHYAIFGPQRSVISEFLSANARTNRSRNPNASLTWDHKGGLPGETFKLDMRVSSSDNTNSGQYATFNTVRPSGIDDSGNVQDSNSLVRIAELTADYQRTIGRSLIKFGLRVGENIDRSALRFTNIDALHNIVSIDARYTNSFDLNATNAALYGSWQWRPNESWVALIGLRAEYKRFSMHQRTTGEDQNSHYLHGIPSAFATYKLNEDTNLRFAYSRRVRYPLSSQMNPFVIQLNDLTESAGNAHLRPVIMDSLEVGTETHAFGLDGNLRAYYKKERGAIQLKSSLINDTVLLLRPENINDSHAAGLEFATSGNITSRLSINVSANFIHNHQNQFDLSGSYVVRSASSFSAQSRLNYRITSDDQLQISVNAQGRTLSGRGYRAPTTSTDLSLGHSLSPTVSLLLKVRNVLNRQDIETITNLPGLKERSLRKYDGRTLYFGASWRFGGVAKPTSAAPN